MAQLQVFSQGPAGRSNTRAQRCSWLALLGCALSALACATASTPTAPGELTGDSTAELAELPASSMPRHRLELEALVNPDGVLKQLRALQQTARSQQDLEELALLYLVEANACRVIANWVCQKQTGEMAARFAGQAGNPVIQARGLIAQARGQIALGDFSRGERTLGLAEVALKASPLPELSADIDLAYSSLSYRLGKYHGSAEYAWRGLSHLGPAEALPMQVRLLRNHAKALILIEQMPEARESLRRAQELMLQVDDPKLRAEIELEVARLAYAEKDTEKQFKAAAVIQRESELLKNSQLAGMADEVRGMAYWQAGDEESARRDLKNAMQAFKTLGLIRDEQRSLGAYLRIAENQADVGAYLRRYLELNDQISLRDRASAGDSFEDRLRYAEQELEIVRLESRAALTAQEHLAALQHLRFSFALSAVAVLLLLALIALYLSQRRWNLRLRDALEVRKRALLQTSHELRNPLSGILGLVELLQRAALPEREARMVQTIGNSAHHLAKLAQDLLDRGRLEAGKLRLEPRATNLSEVITDLVQLHEPLARGKGLRLELKMDEHLPKDLLLDPTRLAQILVNLISNSLKFTEDGGVRLSVEHAFEAASAQHRISFRVEDSGPGMSESEMRQLFEPFRKGEAGHRHQAGAGLGLAICKQLVSLMGGKLWVESSLHNGASFGFELRTQRAVDAASSGALAGSEGQAGKSTTIPTASVAETDFSELIQTPLLVAAIDDDSDILQMHREILTHLGAQVSIYTGAEPFFADPEGKHMDLLIVDYELEYSNGVAFARACRERWTGTLMPRIAVVSGHAAPEQLPNGVDEWLQKPVELSRWIMLLASARHRQTRRVSAAALPA